MAGRTFSLACLARAALLAGLAGCASEAGRGGERVGDTSSADTSACPAGPFPQGVDTSSGQGTITWTSAKNEDGGVSFAILKATQSTDYADPSFPTNWPATKTAGVVRGAYHFFDPTVDGVAQAQYFLKAMGPLDAEDLSPTLDIECPDGDPTCLGYTGGTGDAPAADIRQRMVDWLSTVEAATGRKPILYSFGSYFADNAIDTSGLEAYPLWLADYSGTACFNVPPPWTRAAIWQYGDTGSFKGITGNVDVDHMIGPIDELLGWPAPKRPERADVNGDGKADVCGRDPTGVTCALATATGFALPFAGPAWGDVVAGAGDAGATSWRPAASASTVQFADVNGDGMSDVCGRATAGVTCALSTGTSFGAPFSGPDWSDAVGWAAPAYYATIQFADVNGDGKADACARAALGITCAASTASSTGGGFGAPFTGPAWSDAAGWNTPSRYRTIRFPDIDGDGKADVCGRSSDGLHCALSTGTGFGADIQGPGWSDSTGWSAAAYASTIQFPDIDGDGKADVCARGATGIVCASSKGSGGFGALFDGPAWSDTAGWNAPAYYATIVFLDLDGDGKADVCGRGVEGIECALSLGTSFAPVTTGPAWSDAAAWNEPRYYGTIGAGDVNGDGMDDLCARGPSGMICAPSTGSGFGAAITGPAWSDAVWGVAPYWASVSLLGRARVSSVLDGGVLDGGAPESSEAGEPEGGIVFSASASVSAKGSCSCLVGPGGKDGAGGGEERASLTLAGLGLALGLARRKRGAVSRAGSAPRGTDRPT